MTQPNKESQVAEWEVEQKYFVDDSDLFQQQLAKVGYERSHEESHCDMYFQHPSRDFRQTDEAFRLRRLNNDLWVTYKGQRLDAEVKTRREIELGLVAQDENQWKELLGKLGFTPLPEVRKTRVVYRSAKHDCQGFVVTLDQVDQLGQFAEIEKIVRDPSALSEAQESIEDLAKHLGLSRVQKLSYLAQLVQKLGLE